MPIASGRDLLLRTGALILIVMAYPFYTALAGRTLPPTLLMILAGIAGSLVNGSFAVLLTDLFPTRIRFSGVALGFNIAFTLFSGTAPLVATKLITSTGANTAPAMVMVVSGVLALAGSMALSRYGGHVLGARAGAAQSV